MNASREGGDLLVKDPDVRIATKSGQKRGHDQANGNAAEMNVV